jgi:uncharacterized protein YggE
MMKTGAAAVSFFVVSWTLPLQAQRVSIDAALHTSDKPYIQATGEATVTAKPDQAVIEMGVVTQGNTAAAAAAQNARQTETMLSELRKLLGGTSQIKTTNYSVRPTYQYPKPGASATVAGYTSTNTVEITLNDLAQVGKVIDAATLSGANIVQKLEYGLKNSRALRVQALREAAAEAKASVEAIAAGLGLRVLRVLSAEEAVPDEEFGMKKKVPSVPPGPAPTTPVEPGTIEVNAIVTLRVEIGE